MIQNVFYFNWEPELMEWMQSWMGKVVTWIASGITWLGEETAMILVLGFIYWCYDKKFGKFLATNISVALVANPMLKNVVFRTRPYFNHSGVRCLKPVNASADIYDISAQGYSFPSGHATNSSVVFGTIAIYKRMKVLTVIAIAIPLLVGISRVMLGVHYPTDVIVGWIMGYGIAFLIAWVQTKVQNRTVLHIILFALAIPGCFYCKTTDYYTALGIMAGAFLSMPFEEKFVKFENTKSIPFSILRIIGGVAIYLVLNKLLKMPFSNDFLNADMLGSYLVRTARYGIVVFVMLAIYPMCFKKRNAK